jgi:hypothetical protein
MIIDTERIPKFWLSLKSGHNFSELRLILISSVARHMPVLFTNKIDPHDIAEILLNVVLNNHSPNLTKYFDCVDN